MQLLKASTFLALCAVGALADPGVSQSQREVLIRETLALFFSHLLADHPPAECPPIFDRVEDVLSEMPAGRRESLGESSATAAAWKYVRTHRAVLAVSGDGSRYTPEGLNIRYSSWQLGPPKDENHVLLQVIGGADTNKTGLRKEVGFVLTWSAEDRRYQISLLGLTVNGVIVLDPRGQFSRPADLWESLGFRGPTSGAKQ